MCLYSLSDEANPEISLELAHSFTTTLTNHPSAAAIICETIAFLGRDCKKLNIHGFIKEIRTLEFPFWVKWVFNCPNSTMIIIIKYLALLS